MKSVLVIEDEKPLSRFIEMELQLATSSEWDVILLDLMLQGMDGMEEWSFRVLEIHIMYLSCGHCTYQKDVFVGMCDYSWIGINLVISILGDIRK